MGPQSSMPDPGVRNDSTSLLWMARTSNRLGHRVPESISDASRELDTFRREHGGFLYERSEIRALQGAAECVRRCP
jgi:hypothetical protein